MKKRIGLLVVTCCFVSCFGGNAQVSQENVLSQTIEEHTIKSFERHRVCPEDMVEVNGDYCPNAEEICLQWVNVQGVATKDAVPVSGQTGRCGTFKFPTKCLGTRQRRHFCIDKFEYPNVEGQRPKSWMTWYDVKSACESQGKRLCTKSEWTFACEGPDMKPYPYGDGYHRNKEACNIDNQVPKEIKSIFDVTKHDSTEGQILDDMLNPSGAKPTCVSPFGVYDMVGNIDEFVVNETGRPYKSGLVSGHVFGVRNACRPMTEAHNEFFAWYETGGRCCSFPNK